MNPLKTISDDSSLPADLEHELSRQILHSEKLRAGIQAGVGGVLSVIVAIIGAAQLLEDTIHPLTNGLLPLGPPQSFTS